MLVRVLVSLKYQYRHLGPGLLLLLENVILIYTRMQLRLCMSLAALYTVKMSLSSLGRGNAFKGTGQASHIPVYPKR